ncbi:MAG: RNA 2',3'-cyclic phosphodiesterase [Chloroflexi bacterium]|nr:RNA 2',3'-cyclic phosphodiesterase [Chloroflexota bacterium]
MEEIRSFIAIELPGETREMLARLVDRLKLDGSTSVKWVDPDGIHLTLKFLGNIPATRIAEITEAMALAAEGIPPFFLETTILGAFPNLNRVRVIWIGIGGEVDKLSQLYQRMESSMEVIGFSPEGRAFSPHLTLARVRQYTSPREQQELGQLLTRVKAGESSRIAVNAVSLIRSQLTMAGAIYSRISTVELKP